MSFDNSADVEHWPKNAIWSDCLAMQEYVSVSAVAGGLTEVGGGVTPSDEGRAGALKGGLLWS